MQILPPPGAGHPPHYQHAAPAARESRPERAAVQVPASSPVAISPAVQAHMISALRVAPGAPHQAFKSVGGYLVERRYQRRRNICIRRYSNINIIQTLSVKISEQE